MAGGVNRAAQLWKNWEAQQKQLESLTGLGLESARAIHQHKYDFLRQGVYRISVNPSEQEKSLLPVIASVTDKLQKQLYPNPVLRLLHRIKAAVYDRPVHLHSFTRQREENLAALKEQLKAAGFASFTGRLEKYLDYETPKVNIDMATQLNDKGRLETTLHLERDNFGQYRFDRYQATVTREGSPERTYTFPADSRLTASEAVNLLEGRPVKKAFETADGTTSQQWVQLDFRDKEAKLQHYHEDYGYDLKTALLEHSIRLGIAGLAKERVIENLEKGNLATFNVPDKGYYYFHASPSGHTINLYDQDKRPLKAEELLEKIRRTEPQQRKEINIYKSSGKSQGKGQDQSLHI